MPTPAPKKPRRAKTPAQRATEALDAANRRVDRIKQKRDHSRKETDALEVEYQAVVRRRDYLAKDPDLPADRTPGTPTRTTDRDTEESP